MAEASFGPGEFERKVDAHLTALCGLSYSHIVDMAPELALSPERGATPSEFAGSFAERYSLRTIGSTDGDVSEDSISNTASANERIVAIAAFTNSSRWSASGTGGAYLDVGDDRLSLVACERDGIPAFGVVRDERDENPCIQLDIDDAVRSMFTRLREERDLGVSAPMRGGSEMAMR